MMASHQLSTVQFLVDDIDSKSLDIVGELQGGVLGEDDPAPLTSEMECKVIDKLLNHLIKSPCSRFGGTFQSLPLFMMY
jgi:hypothetical protein